MLTKPSHKRYATSQHTYFLSVFLISCAILTGFTYNLYRQAQYNEQANNWLLHNYDIMRAVQRVRIFAVDMETGERGYLLTRAPEFLDPYNAGIKKLQQAVDELEGLIANSPQQLASLKAIKQRIAVLSAAMDQQLTQFKTVPGFSLTVSDLQSSKDAMDALRQDIADFNTHQRELLERYQQEYRQQQRQFYFTLFIGAALAIGGLVAANLLMMGMISRARRTEAALENARETYQLLLRNLNDGIYDYHPQRNTIIYSDSYAHMLGYDPSEIDNSIERFNALLHPDDYHAAWDNIEKYMRQEIPQYNATFRMRHKDGSWRWIYSRGVGIRNKQGELVRILGVNTDISDQKKREEDLVQLNTDLEGFIYIVSHDLRAPLVNLKGFAGEIEHTLNEVTTILEAQELGLSETDRQRIVQIFQQEIPESLNFIRSGVARMDTLTSAILDLSRIGRREYRVVSVNAQEIATRCSESLRYETKDGNIEIICDNLPEVMTDATALEQIFGNILDNAIKYRAPDRPGLITIRARQLPWETIFSIEDNGRGISEKDYHKVFDIFRRASNTENIRGAGMGLAYIKALLRKLGGRIWFDSRLGEGTVFHFTIPTPTLYTSEKAPHD